MGSHHSREVARFWYDYTTKESLWTVTDPSGFVVVAIATVWLSLAVKYIKKILGNLASKTLLHWGTGRRNADPEQRYLLGPGQTSSGSTSPLASILKETSGIRDLSEQVLLNKRRLSCKERLTLAVFTLVVAGFGTGMIVGGIRAAGIRSVGPVLLHSDVCGLWLFDGETRSDLATRAALNDLAKEERAAQYADNCYRQQFGTDKRRCTFYYRDRLQYGSADFSRPCPFKGNMCSNNITVTFESPIIDASQLGINSQTTHKFRRITQCAPLRMDQRFIQASTENGTTTYRYFYGEKPGADPPVNYTFLTVGDPWDRLAPVYDIFESSDDPIFPADQAVPVTGDSKRWFRNSDPRARPLACLNQIEICTPDERLCLPFRKPDDDTNWEWTPEFTLLYTSLFQTDIFDSIKMRQGRALKAQEAVAGYFSTSLGHEPWANEVENLVAIAHARSQINAWSVASGEDSIHETERYKLVNGTQNTCGLFKYRPQGYATLKGVPLLLVLFLTVVLWVLSLESEVFGPGGAFRKFFISVWQFITRSHDSATISPSSSATQETDTRYRAENSPTNNQLPVVQPGDRQRPPQSTTSSESRTPSHTDTSNVRVPSPTPPSDAATPSAASMPSSNTQESVEAAQLTSTAPVRDSNIGVREDIPNDTDEAEVEWKPLVYYYLFWEGPRSLLRKAPMNPAGRRESNPGPTNYGTIQA
ncbi:hypothetical protein PSPO01_12694 [Paraphaeosphaeria sporulosa]